QSAAQKEEHLWAKPNEKNLVSRLCFITPASYERTLSGCPERLNWKDRVGRLFTLIWGSTFHRALKRDVPVGNSLRWRGLRRELMFLTAFEKLPSVAKIKRRERLRISCFQTARLLRYRSAAWR